MARRPGRKAAFKRGGRTEPIAAALTGHRRSLEGHSRAIASHGKALAENKDALDAHTGVLRAAVRAKTAATREDIRKVLAQIWGVVNPNDVKDVEPLTDYITGGPAAILDFANTLNSRFPGLHLTPGQMRGVTKVGALIDLILHNLK